MSKITNKEIARLAGVSPSTVSIAINGKSGISEETRNRILELARHHDYCTGSNSAKVVKDRSLYIAILFRTDTLLVDQLFYSEMLNTAMIYCRNHGYTLVTSFITGEDSSLELPPSIRNNEVDGILIFGDQHPSIYAELNRIGIPFVILDSCKKASQYPCVYVDYSQASYLATRHLIDLGHRDIAFLGNGSLFDFNNQILSGFQRAMEEENITLYPNRFQFTIEEAEDVRPCLDRAMSGLSKPSAFFCSVDCYALRVIHELNSMGIKVPNEASIVSIDDINVGSYTTPSLSSVRIDRDEMIECGIEMLTSLINGEVPQNHTLSDSTLVARDSTAQFKNNQTAENPA